MLDGLLLISVFESRAPRTEMERPKFFSSPGVQAVVCLSVRLHE